MLLPYELAPEVEYLYSLYVREIWEDTDLPNLQELILMFKRCPYNRIAIEIKSMRALLALGTYTHSSMEIINTSLGELTIAEWVNKIFERMRGSIYQVAGKMFRQCYGLGASVGEIVYSSGQEWGLKKITVIPRKNSTFAGYAGEWDRIIYRSSFKSPFPIPRQKLLHIYIPDVDEPENPNGDPQSARAHPYYLARKQALAKWSTKLNRDAKGVFVIKSDSNDKVSKRDEEGNPIKNADGTTQKESSLVQAVNAAKNLEEGDAFGTDKRNEVQFYPNTSGAGSDFNVAIKSYAEDIFIAYGIPKTILGEGSASLGQSGLNFGHRLILDTQIEAMVEMMRSQLIEKIIKPLLLANFGDRFEDDYGSFESDKFLDPSLAATRVSNIMSGMLQGIIGGNDLEAINRFREDCGLNRISAIDFQRQLLEKLMAEETASDNN